MSLELPPAIELPKRALDLRGERFGMLTARYPTKSYHASQTVSWVCWCDCGGWAVRPAGTLMYGRRKGSEPACIKCVAELRRGLTQAYVDRRVEGFLHAWETYGTLYSPDYNDFSELQMLDVADDNPITVEPGWKERKRLEEPKKPYRGLDFSNNTQRFELQGLDYSLIPKPPSRGEEYRPPRIKMPDRCVWAVGGVLYGQRCSMRGCTQLWWYDKSERICPSCHHLIRRYVTSKIKAHSFIRRPYHCIIATGGTLCGIRNETPFSKLKISYVDCPGCVSRVRPDMLVPAELPLKINLESGWADNERIDWENIHGS